MCYRTMNYTRAINNLGFHCCVIHIYIDIYSREGVVTSNGVETIYICMYGTLLNN